jgi:hypothetical protein
VCFYLLSWLSFPLRTLLLSPLRWRIHLVFLTLKQSARNLQETYYSQGLHIELWTVQSLISLSIDYSLQLRRALFTPSMGKSWKILLFWQSKLVHGSIPLLQMSASFPRRWESITEAKYLWIPVCTGMTDRVAQWGICKFGMHPRCMN